MIWLLLDTNFRKCPETQFARSPTGMPKMQHFMRRVSGNSRAQTTARHDASPLVIFIGTAKGQDTRDGPLYSCLDGVSAYIYSPSTAANPVGRQEGQTERDYATEVKTANAETAKEVSERQTETALLVILVVVASSSIICLVVTIAALIFAWYMYRRRNQRPERLEQRQGFSRNPKIQALRNRNDYRVTAGFKKLIMVSTALCQISRDITIAALVIGQINHIKRSEIRPVNQIRWAKQRPFSVRSS